MVDTKLILLRTEFTPYEITLTIKLAPLGVESFDEPMENVTKKLDAVANYAKSTFAVRTSQLGPNKDGKAVTKNDKPAELVETKLIKKANERVLKVLEGDLARAKEDKNPVAIERAEFAVINAKKRMAKPLE